MPSSCACVATCDAKGHGRLVCGRPSWFVISCLREEAVGGRPRWCGLTVAFFSRLHVRTTVHRRTVWFNQADSETNSCAAAVVRCSAAAADRRVPEPRSLRFACLGTCGRRAEAHHGRGGSWRSAPIVGNGADGSTSEAPRVGVPDARRFGPVGERGAGQGVHAAMDLRAIQCAFQGFPAVLGQLDRAACLGRCVRLCASCLRARVSPTPAVWAARAVGATAATPPL
jgi:hypothetical protein